MLPFEEQEPKRVRAPVIVRRVGCSPIRSA